MDSDLVRARAMREDGASLEAVLAKLRSEGRTMMESVKIVRELEGVSLGEAKIILDGSATWSDFRAANCSLRHAAIASLDLPDTDEES